MNLSMNPWPCLVAAALSSGAAFVAAAHGDVTPQAVDTKGLPALGEAWLVENPYRKNDLAIRIGSSAYNQNCARCHGLEAVPGGIAPALEPARDRVPQPLKARAVCSARHDRPLRQPAHGGACGTVLLSAHCRIRSMGPDCWTQRWRRQQATLTRASEVRLLQHADATAHRRFAGSSRSEC